MLLCTATLGVIAPATALAQGSLQLTVSQPVAGLPLRYAVSGTEPGPDLFGVNDYKLTVDVRTAAEGSCQSDYYLPPPNPIDQAWATGKSKTLTSTGYFLYSWKVPADLQGTGLDTMTMPLGHYLVCAWLDDSQGFEGVAGPLATGKLAFTVRAPRFTLKLSPPFRPHLRQRRAFAMQGTAQVTSHLTVDLLPECTRLRETRSGGIACAGGYVRSCAATPDAEDTYMDNFSQVGIVTLMSSELRAGRFATARKLTFGSGWSPGRHMVCAWIGLTHTDGGKYDQNAYIARKASFFLEQ